MRLKWIAQRLRMGSWTYVSNLLQFTPTLSAPAWQTVATNSPGADGLFQFIDTNGWGQTQRSYRLV